MTMVENESNENQSNVSTQPGLSYYLEHKWKLGVTIFSLFSFITMGLHLEISGSTMLRLSRQIGANLGDLSWIVAARSFGYMITIVTFGVIFQPIIKNHSELILALGYLFPAAATFSTPYLKSLWTLCMALLFQGMVQGISDLAINILITTMWSVHSTAPLNLVYLGYPLGAILSIIIVRSFRTTNSLIVNNSTNISEEKQFQPDLVGPYRIASILCLISSIGFLWIAYKQREYKKKMKIDKIRVYQSVAKEEINIESKPKRLFNKSKFWKTCSPTTCGQGHLKYGFILIILLLFYNFFFGGIEQGFTKFFLTYIEQEEINLYKKYGIYSMIFYWLSMLIGRVLCIYLTVVWLTPQLLLTISILLCLLTYIFWLIFIWYIGLTHLSIFIFVTINGLSISSISPTTIGWLKQFLSLSPIELTLILSSNAIGGIVFGLITGYLIYHYGSIHLFTILIILTILCSIFYLFASIIQYNYSKRENKNKNKNQEMTLQTFIQQDDYFPTMKYIDQ
ncbi:unnamed protein product [Adineta steineri]|uniref:Uncharacterized protein n=1 Tax=Adineta steineri TaxID=433720 RepID=A0A818R8E7_9BILA|nr:unnamed protein product [Adineta steineri]